MAISRVQSLVRVSLPAVFAAACLFVVGCSEQRPLHIVKLRGDQAVADGDLATAISNYDEYVDRKPDGVAVRLALGKAYLDAGQYGRAREQLSTVYDVQPDNEKAIELLAEAYFRNNDHDLLLPWLKRLTLERGTVGDFLRLGRYSGKVGQADEAQVALRTAASLDKGMTLEPQMALAEFYKSVGDRANELMRLKCALSMAPENEAIKTRMRELGEIPGPTAAIIPPERQ